MTKPKPHVNRRPRTYRDNYPTGRKHCACCKHWRPVTDFPVAHWADEPKCTIPRTLDSYCARCQAMWTRQRKGHKPRKWYPHGTPGSERYRAYRNALNRAAYAKRCKDPVFVAQRREYQRFYQDAKAAEEGRKRTPRGKPPPSSRTIVDPKPFLRWFDALADPPWVSTKDKALISTWRTGSPATLEKIDQIMTASGSTDQLAIHYPLDEELSDAA